MRKVFLFAVLALGFGCGKQPGPAPDPGGAGPAELPTDPPDQPPRRRPAAPPDPADFAGKSLPRWREDLRSKDTQTWFVALHAVAALGPAGKDAAPDLLAPQFFSRPEAHAALASYGPDVVPVLLGATKSPSEHTRILAWEVLARVGPVAAPAAGEVAGRLADPDPVTRLNALRVLGRADPTGRLAAPHLPKLLADPDPGVRLAAARMLADADPAADGPAAVLAAGLVQSYSGGGGFFLFDERGTILALRKLGAKGARAAADAARSADPVPASTMLRRVFDEPFGGKDAVAQLVGLVGHRPEGVLNAVNVPAAAAWALGTYGPDAAAAVPPLVAAAADPWVGLRQGAARSLGEIGGDPAVLVPVLRKLLDDPPAAPYAAKSLGQVGRSDPKSVVPLLRPLLASADPQVKAHAAGQLARFTPTDGDAVAALLDLAADPAPGPVAPPKKGAAAPGPAVDAAGRYLLALDPAAAPVLRGFTTDPAPRRRLNAARALVRIDPADAAARKALADLAPTHPAAVAAIYRGLGKDGAAPLGAMTAVPAARGPALAALRELGPDAAPAVPALARLLTGPDDGLHYQWALDALAAVGPAAKPAAPAVRALLRQPWAATQFLAARTLLAIDPDDTTAAPVLAAALKDPKAPGFNDVPTEPGPTTSRRDGRAQVARLLLKIDVAEAARTAAVVPGVFVP